MKMTKDPVCGMEIDKKKAKFSTVKNGKKYFFCSKNCHDKFIKGDGRAEEKGKPQPISATKKTTIPISGMHCASCANNIEMALSKQKGVSKASLNFATEKATVEFDDKLTDENSLKEIIRKTGYKVVGQEKAQEKSGDASELRLKVIGMDNPHCVGTVDNALNMVKGVTSKELHVNQNAFIKYDPKLTNPEAIKKAIKNSGYDSVEQKQGADAEKEAREKEIRRLR